MSSVPTFRRDDGGYIGGALKSGRPLIAFGGFAQFGGFFRKDSPSEDGDVSEDT